MTATEKKTYRVEALGCRTNQYEAQAFRDQLEAMGYEAAEAGQEATISIVNSCTVTESADSHSRHLVRDFIRQSPTSKVIVTGCLAERDPQILINITGVTHVVGNSQKEQLLNTVLPDEEIPEFSIKRFEAHTRAFVKVQDGCNSFCTYCIIPYVRGRSRSKSIDEVVKEVRTLVASGYKEVVLTGINIGDFDGNDPENPKKLVDLVREVDKIPGLERLRISSIDPDEIDEELQQAVLNGKTTCNSMHIVLQSGSNLVLRRMMRKYTRQQFMESVRRLVAQDPDFTVTTDVIVGFPGETDSDFDETIDVLRTVQFAKVHMFPYSVRPRTRAALYPNKVPHDVIQKRKAIVLRVAEEVGFALRERFVGRTMTVITEDHDNTYLSGHTTNFLPVLIERKTFEPNQLLTVELVQNTPKGLIGRVLVS